VVFLPGPQQRLGQPRQDPGSQLAVDVSQRGQRFLKQPDLHVVHHADGELHAEPKGRSGQQLCRPDALGRRGRLLVAGARGGEVTGCPLGLAQDQQQLAAAVSVTRTCELQRLKGTLEMAGRLLISEHVECQLAGPGRVLHRLVRITDGRALQKVMSEFGEPCFQVGLGVALDRLTHAVVQPHPFGHPQPGVDHLADQGVREPVAARTGSCFGHQVSIHRLVQGLQHLRGRQSSGLADHAQVEVPPLNGGHG
jgi:hypothetical protein